MSLCQYVLDIYCIRWGSARAVLIYDCAKTHTDGNMAYQFINTRCLCLCPCICVCVCVWGGGGGGGGGGADLVYDDTSRRLWCAHDAWLRAIWFLAKLALIRCSRIWILLLPSQVYMVLSHRLELRPSNCMNCTSKYIWGLQKTLYILFYDFRTRVYESPVCSFLHIYITFLMFLLRACTWNCVYIWQVLTQLSCQYACQYDCDIQ